jgi:hypothetical protein
MSSSFFSFGVFTKQASGSLRWQHAGISIFQPQNKQIISLPRRAVFNAAPNWFPGTRLSALGACRIFGDIIILVCVPFLNAFYKSRFVYAFCSGFQFLLYGASLDAIV